MPKRSALGIAAIVLVVIIVLAAAGIGVALTMKQSFTPMQTTSIAPSTHDDNLNISQLSSNGLRLTLSISSVNILEGATMSLNVSIFNTLSSQNSPATTSQTDLSLGPCSQLPLGVGIFEGNYSATDLPSSNSPAALILYKPGTYSCPAMFSVSGWSFAPDGDNITLVSNQPAPTDMWTNPAADNVQFSGSWTAQSSSLPFAPGSYTLAAADDWGQAVVLHFQVTTSAGNAT